jgi:hypothetical protein
VVKAIAATIRDVHLQPPVFAPARKMGLEGIVSTTCGQSRKRAGRAAAHAGLFRQGCARGRDHAATPLLDRSRMQGGTMITLID